jgi:hypothetical protein
MERRRPPSPFICQTGEEKEGDRKGIHIPLLNDSFLNINFAVKESIMRRKGDLHARSLTQTAVLPPISARETGKRQREREREETHV